MIPFPAIAGAWKAFNGLSLLTRVGITAGSAVTVIGVIAGTIWLYNDHQQTIGERREQTRLNMALMKQMEESNRHVLELSTMAQSFVAKQAEVQQQRVVRRQSTHQEIAHYDEKKPDGDIRLSPEFALRFDRILRVPEALSFHGHPEAYGNPAGFEGQTAQGPTPGAVIRAVEDFADGCDEDRRRAELHTSFDDARHEEQMKFCIEHHGADKCS